jgi:hypothetical protein
MRPHPRAPSCVPIACLGLLLLSACNWIDASMGRGASISAMAPGDNVSTGELDCWLTIDFDSVPKGVDPRDVRVRFSSIALLEPAEYDWSYIASHDVVPNGGGFGSGYRAATNTQPDTAPPLGEPVKARFPLKARRKIENAPSTIWLEAELYWGGRKQDTLRRTIEHVYSRTPNAGF